RLQPKVARGVRQSHRVGGQHRRDRLPDPPSRPAGVAPGWPSWSRPPHAAERPKPRPRPTVGSRQQHALAPPTGHGASPARARALITEGEAAEAAYREAATPAGRTEDLFVSSSSSRVRRAGPG